VQRQASQKRLAVKVSYTKINVPRPVTSQQKYQKYIYEKNPVFFPFFFFFLQLENSAKNLNFTSKQTDLKQ